MPEFIKKFLTSLGLYKKEETRETSTTNTNPSNIAMGDFDTLMLPGIPRVSHLDMNGNNVFFEPIDKSTLSSHSIRGGDYSGLVKISGKMFENYVIGVAIKAQFGSFVRIYSDEPIKVIGKPTAQTFIEMPLYVEDSDETMLGMINAPKFVESGNLKQIEAGIAALKTELRAKGLGKDLDRSPNATSATNSLSLNERIIRKPDISEIDKIFSSGEHSAVVESGTFVINDNHTYQVSPSKNGIGFTVTSNLDGLSPTDYNKVIMRKMRDGDLRLECWNEKGYTLLEDFPEITIISDCLFESGQRINHINIKKAHQLLESRAGEVGEALYESATKQVKPTPIQIDNRNKDAQAHVAVARDFFQHTLPDESKRAEAEAVYTRAQEFLLNPYDGADAAILCNYIMSSYEYDETIEKPLTSNERLAFTLATEFAHSAYFSGNTDAGQILTDYASAEHFFPSVSMPNTPFVTAAINNSVKQLGGGVK